MLVGSSGGEFGVRGWLKALDAASGKEAWTACNTGTDTDCKIGPELKPFYETDRGKNLGVRSWPPEAWKLGGGTVWGFLPYDPAQNLVIYGTGNPARGTKSGPATTSGRAACSPATRTPAPPGGSTSSARTTTSTTTG